MNSSPSDLMSYCSWAKKNSEYRESIKDYFYGIILYYINFYVFSYTIGDAFKSISFALKPPDIHLKPKHTKRRRTAGRHLSCCDPSPPLGKTVACSFKIKTHFVN